MSLPYIRISQIKFNRKYGTTDKPKNIQETCVKPKNDVNSIENVSDRIKINLVKFLIFPILRYDYKKTS